MADATNLTPRWQTREKPGKSIDLIESLIVLLSIEPANLQPPSTIHHPLDQRRPAVVITTSIRRNELEQDR
jgi:hypothetical protein